MKPEGEVEVVLGTEVARKTAGNTCAAERRSVGFACTALETTGDTGVVLWRSVDVAGRALVTAGDTGAV